MPHESTEVSGRSASIKQGLTVAREHPGIVVATAALTMTANALVCHAVIPAATTYVIKLPLAHECPGKLAIVYVIADGVGDSVTVDTQVAGEYTPSGALTAAGDYHIAISNGQIWIEVKEVSTP